MRRAKIVCRWQQTGQFTKNDDERQIKGWMNKGGNVRTNVSLRLAG